MLNDIRILKKIMAKKLNNFFASSFIRENDETIKDCNVKFEQGRK